MFRVGISSLREDVDPADRIADGDVSGMVGQEKMKYGLTKTQVVQPTWLWMESERS